MKDRELCLQYVVRFMNGKSMDYEMRSKRVAIHRRKVRFLSWEGRLYHRGEKNLTTAVLHSERNQVLHFFHDAPEN